MRQTIAARVGAWALPLVTCAALLAARETAAADQDVAWRAGSEPLAREKALAEGCASILKSFVGGAPMARVQGERLYARAKADMDGLIALVIVDLASARPLADTPELRHRLGSVSAQRQGLCRHVDAAIGTALRRQSGRSIGADLLAEGSEDPPGSPIEAAAQIQEAYEKADPEGRAGIVAGLGALRWRPYGALAGASDEQAPGTSVPAAAQPWTPNRPRGRKNRTAAISR